MSFIYYCMHCSQKIDVDDSLENKAAVCPTCNKSIFLMKTPQCGTAAENTPAPQNCPQVQLLHQQMQTVPQQNVQQIVCEIPSGGGRAYKIFHEPLKVCLALFTINLIVAYSEASISGPGMGTQEKTLSSPFNGIIDHRIHTLGKQGILTKDRHMAADRVGFSCPFTLGNDLVVLNGDIGCIKQCQGFRFHTGYHRVTNRDLIVTFIAVFFIFLCVIGTDSTVALHCAAINDDILAGKSIPEF